jgi:hypothetical protein
MEHLPDTRYAYALGQWKMDVTGDAIKSLLFLHYRLSAQRRTTSWKSLASLVTFIPQEPPSAALQPFEAAKPEQQ